MSRTESRRFEWPSLRRALEALLREVDQRSLTGVSLHGIEGREVRLSYTCRDERRDVEEMPGIRVEADESDFDEADTDVDP